MALSGSELIDSLQWRYATKVFDVSRKITAEDWSALEESLVLTPSSYGMQPWKFLVITDKALREKLVGVSWNQRQVADASHLVVLAAKITVTEEDLDRFITRMVEVRGGSPESLLRFRDMLARDLINGERGQYISEWAIRQCYIALGQFMASAAIMGIDTCPMEGFDPAAVNEILQLPETGYRAVLLCPAGYRSEDDRFASLPKVRFKTEDVIEHR